MNPVESQMVPEPSPQDLAVVGRAESSTTLDALLDVSMPIVIEIGRAQMTVQEVLQLGAGRSSSSTASWASQWTYT